MLKLLWQSCRQKFVSGKSLSYMQQKPLQASSWTKNLTPPDPIKLRGLKQNLKSRNNSSHTQKPGFHMICNGRRRPEITVSDHLRSMSSRHHILLAIADQVIPQVLICLVRNKRQKSQFSLGSY